MRFLEFQQKSYQLRYICFFALTRSVRGLLTFRKNNMFAKNLVVELWSKNLKANQNAGFFKLEHLTKIT